MANNDISWYKKWWGIPLIVILTVFLSLLLAASLYVFSLAKKITTEKRPAVSEKRYDAENENSYYFGAADPKITIVEFSDFACPFCKNSYPVIRDIVLKYNKDVR
ncbi:MAG: thioredoxin domain-containing protein, partial [Patescibacteria group bacterium]